MSPVTITRITSSAQELRERTWSRQKLVSPRISCSDQVRAVLAKLGVPVTLHVDLVCHDHTILRRPTCTRQGTPGIS